MIDLLEHSYRLLRFDNAYRQMITQLSRKTLTDVQEQLCGYFGVTADEIFIAAVKQNYEANRAWIDPELITELMDLVPDRSEQQTADIIMIVNAMGFVVNQLANDDGSRNHVEQYKTAAAGINILNEYASSFAFIRDFLRRYERLCDSADDLFDYLNFELEQQSESKEIEQARGLANEWHSFFGARSRYNFNGANLANANIIAELQQNYSQVTSLHLSHVRDDFNDDDLRSIIKHTPNLQRLSVANNRYITLRLPLVLPYLKYLAIQDCPNLQDFNLPASRLECIRVGVSGFKEAYSAGFIGAFKKFLISLVKNNSAYRLNIVIYGGASYGWDDKLDASLGLLHSLLTNVIYKKTAGQYISYLKANFSFDFVHVDMALSNYMSCVDNASFAYSKRAGLIYYLFKEAFSNVKHHNSLTNMFYDLLDDEQISPDLLMSLCGRLKRSTEPVRQQFGVLLRKRCEGLFISSSLRTDSIYNGYCGREERYMSPTW